MTQPIDWRTYPIDSLYDSIGQGYEIAYADIPAQQRSLEWLVANLPRPGSRILDMGCGTGRPVASALSASPHQHRVHGLDISPVMIAAARASVPSATFELVDLRLFQAQPDTFDAVVSYFALLVAMSQDQIRETLARAFVWLRPGGLLVIGTVPADVEHFQQTWLGRKAVFSSLTEEQFASLLTGLGFVIELIELENFMPKAAEVGLCGEGEVMLEPQLFIYARKPLSSQILG